MIKDKQNNETNKQTNKKAHPVKQRSNTKRALRLILKFCLTLSIDAGVIFTQTPGLEFDGNSFNFQINH